MENVESLRFLVDYIIGKYHKSIRENLPIIQKETKELVLEYRDIFPELIQIEELLKQFKIEIDNHIEVEENEFFTLLIKIEDKLNGINCDFVDFDLLVKKLENEHENFDTYVYSLVEIYKNCDLKNHDESKYEKLFNLFYQLEMETKEHTEYENHKLHPLAREKFKQICKLK